LNAREPEQVDQALFGYSDGHRQIAASVRLPSKDQYLLAVATDLASGSRLGPEDSYLTGLPLTESRRFALIRTWSAPEMPRPGCVWSHVILIHSRLLSSHGDLADLLCLLRRPDGPDTKFYDEPLPVASFGQRASPDPNSVIELIRAYYSNKPVVLRPNARLENLEAAIIAVWSQQWPRLRTSFSFRTAQGRARRRSELINYDVEVGSVVRNDLDLDDDLVASQPSWIMAAAADAVQSRVSPLRRFLWRYGRDLLAPRTLFPALVQLYLETEGERELSADQAIRIFEAIPEAADGGILKRDILGISSVSPSLCPPLPLTELIQLLAQIPPEDLPAADEIQKRFDLIPSNEVAQIAAYLGQRSQELGHWKNVLTAGIIASANQSTLVGDLPDDIRTLILKAREELITPETIAALKNDGLLELVSTRNNNDTKRTLANEIVRRDFDAKGGALFKSEPGIIFKAAVEAARRSQLHASWPQTIRNNSSAISVVDWPSMLSTTTDLAIGLSWLQYPKVYNEPADAWVRVLLSMEDDVAGEDRIRLHAYLLKDALRHMTSATWKLLAIILPKLRPIILQSSLPNDVYQMLVDDLPRFYAAEYWDLDRRILLSLSNLKSAFPDDQGALLALNLSATDMHVVNFGKDEDQRRSRSRFWPWY
jgi:hypothetical protein